jgi:hypothetical protein
MIQQGRKSFLAALGQGSVPAGERQESLNFVTECPISGTVEEEGAAAMTVTLNLNPEVEKGLMARALARGVSLDDYLQELIAKEAGVPAASEPRPARKPFDNLSDLLLNSPFAGANLDLERSKDHPRPVDLG